MRYKSKDLKISDFGKFLTKKYQIVVAFKIQNEILNFLSESNPKKYYSPDTEILSKEWNALLEEFDNADLFETYQLLIQQKHKTEKTNKIKSLKIEFQNYFLNHEKIIKFSTAEKLEININYEDINTQFKYSYRSKLNDDDYIYGAFETEINDYKFFFEIENPSRAYDYFKNHEEYFLQKAYNVQDILYRNLYRYKIYDLTSIIDDLFKETLDENSFTFNYQKLNKILDNLNIISNENVKFYVALHPEKIDKYNYFEKLDIIKTRSIVKKTTYFLNKYMRNIKITTKDNVFILLKLESNQSITNGIIDTIKTEDKLEEILLNTYENDKKYILLGKLSDDFDFTKIGDVEINSKEKFNKLFNRLYLEKIGNTHSYYLFKLSK